MKFQQLLLLYFVTHSWLVTEPKRTQREHQKNQLRQNNEEFTPQSYTQGFTTREPKFYTTERTEMQRKSTTPRTELITDKSGKVFLNFGATTTTTTASTSPGIRFKITNDTEEYVAPTKFPVTREIDETSLRSVVKRELRYSTINWTKTHSDVLNANNTSILRRKVVAKLDDVVKKEDSKVVKNKFAKDVPENLDQLLQKSVNDNYGVTIPAELGSNKAKSRLTDEKFNALSNITKVAARSIGDGEDTSIDYRDLLKKSQIQKPEALVTTSEDLELNFKDEFPTTKGSPKQIKNIKGEETSQITTEFDLDGQIRQQTTISGQSASKNSRNVKKPTTYRPKPTQEVPSRSDSIQDKLKYADDTVPYYANDDLQQSASADTKTCELDDADRQRVENIFPFIVMEPVTKMHDQDGNEYNIWCEGIMISNIWGIAPPKCFIETDATTTANSDYYINVNEINSTITRTYIATIQTFVPNHLIYIRDAAVFCNYIGLFKILNFNFYFKMLIPLPSMHYKGDLTENMNIEECKIIGAEFLDAAIQLNVASFPLMDVQKYCGEHQTCSPASCVYYNYNVTYLEMDIPRSKAETGCRFDIGYQWGTSLICLDSNDRWLYYGMATSEAKVFCGPSGEVSQGPGYQAFTRVDSYLKWIKSVVNANGGWNPI